MGTRNFIILNLPTGHLVYLHYTTTYGIEVCTRTTTVIIGKFRRTVVMSICKKGVGEAKLENYTTVVLGWLEMRGALYKHFCNLVVLVYKCACTHNGLIWRRD